jgi:hypothetical protein
MVRRTSGISWAARGRARTRSSSLSRVERLVCALYGLSDALTERVVESAVARAGSVATQAEE